MIYEKTAASVPLTRRLALVRSVIIRTKPIDNKANNHKTTFYRFRLCVSTQVLYLCETKKTRKHKRYVRKSINY